MGMHIGLIVAKTSATELRDTFFQVWPQYDMVAMKGHLPSEAAMEAWKKSHE